MSVMHIETSTKISKAYFDELVSQTKEGPLSVKIEGKYFNDATYSASEAKSGERIIKLRYTCREFLEATSIGHSKIPESSHILNTLQYIFDPQGQFENAIYDLVLIQPNLRLPISVGGASDVYSLDQLELSREAKYGPSIKVLLEAFGNN